MRRCWEDRYSWSGPRMVIAWRIARDQSAALWNSANAVCAGPGRFVNNCGLAVAPSRQRWTTVRLHRLQLPGDHQGVRAGVDSRGRRGEEPVELYVSVRRVDLTRVYQRV